MQLGHSCVSYPCEDVSLTRSFQTSPAAGLAFVLLLALSACGAVDSTSTEVEKEGGPAVAAVEETAADTSNMTTMERAEARLRTVPGQLAERLK